MVGVLAAGGMMGGLALFLAEMTKQQHVAQKVAETGVEITALHSRVVSLLADGEACKKTLEGTPVNPAPTITGFKNRKGRDVLAVPSAPFNRLVKLRDAKLTNIQGTGTTREVEVELTFEKLSKAISGQKTVTRLIPLTLELDTANSITSCHSPQNYVMKEQLCKEMGGTWNGSNKKCSVPDCSTGQALTKTSTGFACVSAGSLPNCPNGKIIKRVGGIWKCEDPPQPAPAPTIPDMSCTTQGEAVTSIVNGVPVCGAVAGISTVSSTGGNTPAKPPQYTGYMHFCGQHIAVKTPVSSTWTYTGSGGLFSGVQVWRNKCLTAGGSPDCEVWYTGTPTCIRHSCTGIPNQPCSVHMKAKCECV